MSRKAKITEAEGKILHSADKPNGISEDELKELVGAYEDQSAAIKKIMENARLAAQPHRDELKEIAKRAAEQGCEKKVFKAKVRERNFLRKAGDVPKSMTPRQKSIFEEISAKLGNWRMSEELLP